MNNTTFMDLFKTLQQKTTKFAPELLLLGGTISLGTTIYFAISDTPKALYLIEQEEVKTKKTLTRPQKFKTTWKCYARTALFAGLTTGCFIGSQQISHRRGESFAAAFALTQATLKQYREKVKETVGEKKEQIIRDKVAQDIVDKSPKNNAVAPPSVGNIWCYDAHSGRRFPSNRESLREIKIDLNERLQSEMYISLNDFYYEVGLPTIKLGNMTGWNVDDGKIHFSFSSILDDGVPCLFVDYDVSPRRY